MTRNDYIFKNATQIAEQRIRAARKLQANEAARMGKETVGAIMNWGICWTRALLRGKSLSS